MSAPDPLAKLKALTKSTSGEQTFAHESEEDVLRKLTGIFAKIPSGQKLLDAARAHGTQIKLLKGGQDFSFSPESNTVFLGLPASQSAPKARMLLYMAMGLEEARQEYEGFPRPDFSYPKDQFVAIHDKKQRDIRFTMCAVAHDLIQNLGLREILDELAKMGHIKLYEAYVEDLQSAS